MDAIKRKEAWTNIEDEMWELEIRWQWLLFKVQDGRTGNFNAFKHESITDADNPMIPSHENSSTVTLTQEEETPSSTQKEKPVEIKILSNTLATFLESLIIAVKQTIHQLAIIKDLMWVNWEDNSICESFYDALQYSHQLLESLSSTWGIVMSIFRSSLIEILYLSEKVVAQIAFSHQVAVEFIMACWQSYLVVYNCKNPLNINHAQVKVRSSCHIVGEGYARALVESHLFTQNITFILSANGSNISSSLSYSDIEKTIAETESKFAASFKPGSKVSKDSREDSELCQNRVERKTSDGVKKIAQYGYSTSNDDNIKGSSTDEVTDKKHLSKITKYAFKKIPILSHMNNKKAQIQSQENHILTLSSERSSPAPEHSKSKKKICSECCLEHSCSAMRSEMESVDPNPICCFEETDELASQPMCNCCCMINSRGDQDLDEDCEGTTSNTSSSSDSTITVPRFSKSDWQALISDSIDLRADIKSMLSSVTLSSIEECFVKTWKDCMSVDVSDKGEADEKRLFFASNLMELFTSIASSQLFSLELIERELSQQMQTWEKKEELEMLQSHIKGLDPDEALLQAKNLLSQQLQAFFSLMLLLKATTKRRLVNYSTLLCDSFAEARSLSTSLVLARSVTCDNRMNLVASDEVVSPAGQDSVVNPHTLSHKHSLALTNSHAFCDSLFSFILTT